MFSFGSGMCSSFYSITVRPGAEFDTLISNLLQHVPKMLEKRYCVSAVEFEKILKDRELTYNKGNNKTKHILIFNYVTNVIFITVPFYSKSNIDELFSGSWYLTHIDSTFKRYYKVLATCDLTS